MFQCVAFSSFPLVTVFTFHRLSMMNFDACSVRASAVSYNSAMSALQQATLRISVGLDIRMGTCRFDSID